MSPDRQGAQVWKTASTWWLTPYMTAFAARREQGRRKDGELRGGIQAHGLDGIAVVPEAALWGRAAR